MNVRKVVAGSVLAAGLGVAGVFGAGTASAAPGISYSDGGANDFGMGDNTATGAQAKASEGNQALAVSLFGPSVADASGKGGSGNIAIAGSGSAATVTNGSGNIVVANTFSSSSVKNGDDNVLIGALGSDVNVENKNGNTAVGFVSDINIPNNIGGNNPQTVVAVCGTSVVAAQSDKVSVSGPCAAA